MANETIEVEGGAARGVLSQGMSCLVYKGIPYAAAPVGALRWCAPQPVKPWEGVLVCDRFGCASVQPLLSRDALMSTLSFAVPPECGISESCLYLNVWTPASKGTQTLPVIVWLHGGGFRVGAGSHPGSDGENLASRGAVVVTVNYRLNSLGFLAHPKLTEESGFSGNYACLDALAALRWVKTNIAAFGGDPKRVTLMGQSAGAMIVSALMAAPAAQGLFHRAIANSGSVMHGPPMRTLKQAEAIGEKMFDAMGARSLEEMRNLPADTLYGPPGSWQIIVDGSLIIEDVEDSFSAGRQAHIPLLTGFTSDEGSPYPKPDLFDPVGFTNFAKRTFGNQVSEFLAIFPASPEQVRASSYAWGRDSGFAGQAWRLAKLHLRANAPTFVHYFSRAVPLPGSMRFREPIPPGGYGAYHGSVIWYAFDSLHLKGWPWESTDREIASSFASFIVNFAATGSPNGEGLPHWPVADATTPGAMHFGDRIEWGRIPNIKGLEFLDRWYRQQTLSIHKTGI